jgi:SprT protein
MVEDRLDIRKFAIQTTHNFINKANSLYRIQLPYPEISFQLKGTYAGKAFGRRWLIKYNYPLLEENFEDFVNITVPHETAHLVEFKLFGKAGHKDNWKRIMKDFGIQNPKRCHNYKIIQKGRRRTR